MTSSKPGTNFERQRTTVDTQPFAFHLGVLCVLYGLGLATVSVTTRPEAKQVLRGLTILVARLTVRDQKRIFSLYHYFAIMKPVAENESRHLGQNEMAGLKGKSGLQAT